MGNTQAHQSQAFRKPPQSRQQWNLSILSVFSGKFTSLRQPFCLILEGDVPGTAAVATQHPKVTTYIPQPILDALDAWKSESGIESRSAAIVTLLADYLGVPYPVQPQGDAPTIVPSKALSTVQAELAKLTERVAALEQQMEKSTALFEVPGTALEPPPFEATVDVNSAVLATAPQAPLTQSALARRLGCSDKAVEKHRRHGDKENFAAWSRDRDPDNIAWPWEGAGGRGQPLRFVPLN